MFSLNTAFGIVLLALYPFVSCYGLYLMKAAPMVKSWGFLIGFICYAAGAVIWLFILRIFPLSTAFPIAAGSLVIGTMLTGVFFLNEQVTGFHLAGALMIIVGIVLLSLGK